MMFGSRFNSSGRCLLRTSKNLLFQQIPGKFLTLACVRHGSLNFPLKHVASTPARIFDSRKVAAAVKAKIMKKKALTDHASGNLERLKRHLPELLFCK